MMRFSNLLAAAAPAGLLLAALHANAAPVTYDVTFSAPFTAPNYGGGAGPSYNGGATPGSVSGSFRIIFDPTMTCTDDTAGITNAVLTGITLDSPFSFDHSPTGNSNGAADELVVGGLNVDACCVAIDPSPNQTTFTFKFLILRQTPCSCNWGIQHLLTLISIREPAGVL